MKYDTIMCPKCRKETIHRTRRKYGMASRKGGKESFLKYEAKHCLVCNHYWGYSKDKKEKRSIHIKI